MTDKKRIFIVEEFEFVEEELISSDYYYDEAAQGYAPSGVTEKLQVYESHDGIYHAVLYRATRGGLLATIPENSSFTTVIEMIKVEEVDEPPEDVYFIELWTSDDRYFIDFNKIITKLKNKAYWRQYRLEQEIYKLQKEIEELKGKKNSND